jgi:mono/diheme cytochrome c family protein
MLRFAPRQALVALMLLTPALAAPSDVQRGKAYASRHCAKCHAIDLASNSPLKIAPPFRTLHTRYPIESLAESLAEGITTGHPAMPRVELSPDQIHDLLAFLKTLE